MNPTTRQESRFPVPGGERLRTRIKFCGFTRSQDIEGAARLGADAIGLVCVPGSKRELTAAQAADLRASVPPFMATVLLLSNADEKRARSTIEMVKPDFVQFHGQESGDFCTSFGRPYFKAVAMKTADDVHRAAQLHPAAVALILDSHGEGGLGGTGRTFDWTRIPQDSGKPLLLAGGLTAANVGEAVRMVVPYAVDVSSGIETSPGYKNFEKMKAFVEAVRLADAEMQR